MASPTLPPPEYHPEPVTHVVDPDSVTSTMSTPTIDQFKDEEAAQKEETQWKPAKEEYLVMSTLAFISLMVALDATILVPVLPTLARDLKGTAIDAFWAGTAYLLTNTVFQPFIAALSDIFGRRELLIPSLLLFTIGSIVCGVAHDFATLLAGRCVQGVGGGGIITLAQVVFADIIPLRQRPKYFSAVLLAWALGSMLGPLVGAVFVQKSTWRWCFWVNLPFCGIGLIVVPLFVRLKTATSTFKEKLALVDWTGGFLFISGLTSFLIGLSWAGIQFEWTSFRTLVPLILGAAAVVVCIIWERFGSRQPFLTKSLFHKWSAVAAYLSALFQGLTLFMSLYYAPFYFLAVPLKSPIAAGVLLFPATCFLLPGSAVVSQLITRFGHFRWAVWLGWVLSVTGAGITILWQQHTSLGIWVAALVIYGVGNGMVLSSLNFCIQAIVKPEDAGRAASMYAFMRTLGMTIGVAIGGTVFQNLMAHKLRDFGLPVELAKNAEGYISQLGTLSPSEFSNIEQAYVHGFKGIWVTLTGIAGLGMMASLFIKHHSMDAILLSRYKIDR